MSSNAQTTVARAPKRARGKQRVAELLEAAAAVFAEKGYEAATMTEIAARARAPIGSLYQGRGGGFGIVRHQPRAQAPQLLADAFFERPPFEVGAFVE